MVFFSETTMPISFIFKDRNGTKISIAEIDKEICNDFNAKCNDLHYSAMLMAITNIGDFSTKSGEFRMEDFNEAMSLCGISEDDRWKMLKYIQGKYNYYSWR